jgi:predicted PurR-regulated permease PerM
VVAGRSLTILLGVIAATLFGWVLHVGAAVLRPLAIAVLLATVLQPLVAFLARRHIPPTLTVVLLALTLFLGLAQAGVLLQGSVSSFVSGSAPIDDAALSERQQALISELGGWGEIVVRIRLQLEESNLPLEVVDFVQRTLSELDLERFATSLIGGGAGFLTTLLLIVLYMLFIFAEQAVFRDKILTVAGDRREQAGQMLDTIGRGIQRYLGVKTVASLATGAFCYAMLVLLDIPYALLFGILTALLNFIPTFGSIIASALPTLTALAVGASWQTVLVVVATYLAVNLVIGSYLEPKVLGRELNLSPLVILLSVVVWGSLWGVVGAFLAVPLTAAIQCVLAAQESTRPVAILLSSGPPEAPPAEPNEA